MFSDENNLKEKRFFFFVFDCILKNVPENILQYCTKNKVEGVGVEACVF